MNRRECAILTAYTGIMFGYMEDYQRYAEEKLGRPVLTHEFANKNISKILKKLSHDDFIEIMRNVK